jgi:cytochrome c553
MRLLLLCLIPLALPAQDTAFFESKIRPVLATQCYQCHGPEKQFAGLRVDSIEALRQGGRRGPAVIPGKAAPSLIVQAIRHQGGLQMPMGGKLKDSEIAAIEQWIAQGAQWPATAAPAPSKVQQRYLELAREHWAFQPVRKPPVPAGPETHPVDRFIRAELARKALTPAGTADPRTIVRRLSYVLTGLPATHAESAAFAADPSPRAYQLLVDRLLQSPRFGEHWARHWLDVVRFGETRGYEWNYEITGAWRYRDYLIRAFNSDVPYDQLVREHIAGDLLEHPRLDGAGKINESLTATAFFRLGEAGHDNCIQFREIATDVVDNQIDTLTKSFQGLTASCARCHDHKLDPIPRRDYHSFYAILNRSRQVTHITDTPQVTSGPAATLRALKAQIRGELAGIWRRDVARMEERMQQFTPPAKAEMEDPAYPLIAVRDGKELAALAGAYSAETAARAEFNGRHFTPFEGWQPAGPGVEGAQAGGFAISPEGGQAVSGIYPAGTYTHLTSSRLAGALRSPYLPKTHKYLSVRAMGGMLAARRTVIDNCAIGEDYKVIDASTPAWIRLDTFAKEDKLPVFVEFVTRWNNPRIPDRPGVLKGPQLKMMHSPRSYFGLAGAVLHDIDETPKATLTHMERVFTGAALARRYAEIARDVVERWAANGATDDDALWLQWFVQHKLLSNETSGSLADIVARYRQTEAEIPAPSTIDGIDGGGAFGDPPAPRLLSFWNGGNRRELAEHIAAPTNPLTARVMVNRIWHHVFGRGLVATPDNFGTLGDPPSHPELLDYLAARFIEENWSIKRLIQLLVTSETFRQSGAVTAKARETDPQNKLLHHYPLRRLSAESLRDTLLAVSGKLQPTMYGPSIDPYRAEAKDYRRLFAGPLDGAGRRSIYLKVTRMEGNTFLETFDYPNPMATRGSRDVTNVPLQALTMLNDPFVLGEAEATARRLMAAPAASLDQRLDALFRLTLARAPDAVERARFSGLARELASLHRSGDPLASFIVWKDVAHAVFNLKEFLYIP